MRIKYAFVFKNASGQDAAIVVGSYDPEDHTLYVTSHVHGKKNLEYVHAYLQKDEGGLEEVPFYARASNERNRELNTALAVLKDRLSGAKSSAGLAAMHYEDVRLAKQVSN